MIKRFAVGVDPGNITGCVCIVDGETHEVVFYPMKKWEALQFAILDLDPNDCFAVVEKVWIFGGQGRRSGAAFMRNAGMLEGMLSLAFIPCERVLPKTWQEEFFPRGLSRHKTERKTEIHQAAMQALGAKIPKYQADSYYLAKYAQLLAGTIAKGAGRPRKNKVRLHAHLNPQSKLELERLSKEFGCSYGEVIEIMLNAPQSASLKLKLHNLAIDRVQCL
jgi:hypothetical protein